MKSVILLSVLVLFTSVGCGPSKSKACEGCDGSNLQYCEMAYEECLNVSKCREVDIRRVWAEDRCVPGH